ncbi:hypothetical protein ACFC0M_11985 [Streptomyces sp. NPDC056149]|uniref:hypothetical protein n=1 Tax=unclassified Streptomyces TaxID=2593676 RepID=UPI0023818639|nr:hypothetical protein [Streptomyces sp. WZ-12]
MINKQCARAAIAVIAAALSLSACGSTSSGQSDKPPTTGASTSAADPSSADKSSGPAGAPSPDAQQTRTLMAALKAVDPALGGNEAWAVTGAKTVCADIQAGQADADVEQGVQLRFTGTRPGTVPKLTTDQAARIVTAVKSSFCK